MPFPRIVPAIHLTVGRLILTSIVAGIVASPTPQAFGQVCVPVVPCGDKKGCPDLVFDPTHFSYLYSQIMTFSSTDCSVVEGEVVAGTRNMLLFNTDAANLGPGDLFLGDPNDHPEWFDLVTCHGHPHLKDYAAFRLWTPKGYTHWLELRAAAPQACADQIFAAHAELSSQLLSGSKHAFCLEDDEPMKVYSSLKCPAHASMNSRYSCGYQGISVCWEDSYYPGLSSQWIDITGLRDGDYVLENEVNDKHFMTETDYTNNSGAIKVRILGGVATPLP